MKLATALSERADLQIRLSQLSSRLNSNAKVQEGENPSEKPEDLLDELDQIINRMEELIARINKTNSSTFVDGVSITEMLAKRDALTNKIRVLREFLSMASNKVDRYSTKEILIKSTVDVAKLQKTVDALSKQLRELDEAIQQANWNTDLL